MFAIVKVGYPILDRPYRATSFYSILDPGRRSLRSLARG
jgi:hypothetical protein